MGSNPAAPTRASSAASAVRLTLRLDVGGRPTLGPGKVRLLELVAEHGSISAAARAMGMSYRRAWALTEALNTAFVEPVVATRPGGPRGGGADLLPLGVEIVQLYRALEAEAANHGAGSLQGLARVLRGPGECGVAPRREVGREVGRQAGGEAEEVDTR